MARAWRIPLDKRQCTVPIWATFDLQSQQKAQPEVWLRRSTASPWVESLEVYFLVRQRESCAGVAILLPSRRSALRRSTRRDSSRTVSSCPQVLRT